ncbi:hypothetical protein D5086_027355 [Populus alba]|uniref:Uncharacterized protein n=1 Tax=Populus alba TaxID=43335 RepID=A0ACC4AVQ2_POPAL
MGTLPDLMKKVYEAASEGKWDLMKEAYDGEYDKYNAHENTVLHEAVFAGNMKAVELLLEFTPEEQGDYDPSMQLQTKNALGETPFYRAAACGT